MSRLQLEKNKQSEFLFRIHDRKNWSWEYIADICGVTQRTLRDWKKEKFKISYEAFLKLEETSGILLGSPVKILPEFWGREEAAKKGGQRRIELFGNFGSQESRRNGGLSSQKKFRDNPNYARDIGVKVRNIINYPKQSDLLSEFIGIMLGDGGISRNQARITFDRSKDLLYAHFIQELIFKLFEIKPKVIDKKTDKGSDIVIYSRNFVDFLVESGLKIGSKIKNDICVPSWILANNEYKISCLRGMFDTDGSVYFYDHIVNNKKYLNLAICFTSFSPKLLGSIFGILKDLNFLPTKTKNKIYLNKNMDIVRYFDIISSNNYNRLNKYKQYLAKKSVYAQTF